MSVAAHDALAVLLDYPGRDLPARAPALAAAVALACPAASEELAAFIAAVSPLSLGEWEELYTRTFDVNPSCTLEVGWQMYGEQYARGTLMARLRGLLREHGVAETAELPDHLTQVLRLLGRMEAPAAAALVRAGAGDAVGKMRKSLEASGNPYEGLLAATSRLLGERAAASPEPAREEAVHE